jgi:tetratricopeptide (TPR) repeat protein
MGYNKPSPPLGKPRVRVGFIILFVLLAFAAAGTMGYVVLTQSIEGQMQLAAWGYQTTPEAYWRLGESQLREFYVGLALETLQTAYAMQPDNVDGCLLLGTAYERNSQPEKAEALYKQLLTTAPLSPTAYTRLAGMYRDQERHQDALTIMEQGYEQTGSETFTTMIQEYAPSAPEPSQIGGRSNQQIHLTIKAAEGCTIHYTLDGADPLEFGQLYTGEMVFDEGSVRVRAIAVQQNGVPSKEMDETYTVIYPTPNAPKANVASGQYEKAPLVSLRADEGTVAIYYTIDNTPPTIHSPLYTGPIRLPLGNCNLRAIAVDGRGKVSYEMNISYKVKGAVKKMFNKDDAFEGLDLMKTTYDQFVRAYGEPGKYEQVDAGAPQDTYRADYHFGYACFIQVEAGGKAVLYELSTTSAQMAGPRKLQVGDSEEKVLSAFRDYGGPSNDKGERVLYNNNDNSLGTYTLESDGTFAAHYYYPRAKNEYAELSFYFQKGAVARIHWLRYMGE